MTNAKLTKLFLVIIIVGAGHMAEQIVLGVEEFRLLKAGIGGWWTLFPSTYGDEASVILITIVFTTMSLLIYGAMRGGKSAIFVAALFGVLGVQEAHHWIEAIERGTYDPGLVTSFAYVWVGALILREVWFQVTAGLRVAPCPERVMPHQLAAGLVHSQTLSVCECLTVPHVSPAFASFADMPPVFATAFLVGFVEWVCVEALRPCLGADEQSVGVHVDLSHAAATPMGMNVTAQVELVEINGSRLRFKVMCRDEAEVVSEGYHERHIIKRKRFDQRMSGKQSRSSASDAGQASLSPASHTCHTGDARRLALE